MRSLAVLGNLSRDVIDGTPPRVGGGPYHAARALRLTAVPARILAKCADRDLLRALAALGMPVRWVPAQTTAEFSLTYDGDRREMSIEALGDPWTPEEARLAGSADWVHVAPLARSDFPPETLAALGKGRRLSLDGQGLVRPARTGRVELDADFDPALLRHVSILKLAEEEAEVVGDVSRLGVPEVVVTLGSRGAVVQGIHVAAEPVPHRDPTGAGDAFAVSYLAARALGYRPVPAARRAAQVVSSLLR